MGSGFLKERNKVRAAQFNQIVREAQRLEAENRALKSDPQGVVGQFLGKLNQLQLQNNKLSALAASLLQVCGGSVRVSRALLESFGNSRVIIKVEGNADTEEGVTEYIFSYEKMAVEDPNKPITVADAPAASGAPITVNDPQPVPAALVDAANEVESTVAPVEITDPEGEKK